MSFPPPIPRAQKTVNRWWFFLWGFLAGLAVAGLCAALFLIIRISVDNSISPTAGNPVFDARIELSVGADGCSVVRGEPAGATPVSNLTWVIRDMDGTTVLERNAEGEFTYRYFGSGRFTVYITAWYAGSYHRVSDEVSIDC